MNVKKNEILNSRIIIKIFIWASILFKKAESLKAPDRAQPLNADFMTREFLVGIQ